MLNEFGTTERGRAWLRLAEPLRVVRPNPHLVSARSLARSDRVELRRTVPGRIEATVADRRTVEVELTFPLWDDAELAAARGGEFPGLVPDDGSVRARCGCGRSGDARCRHVLATLIELARRVDESPELAPALRGLEVSGAAADPTRIRIADLDPSAFWT
ncbi:hypothetical protein [Actinomycetospora termitidis]|uniref:SWIM-type domain-containing protein n=1 Tax=Actinomycetospora termitidis TaxID=3053470 RepID=A0ABT7M7Y7_9PSEU|nr:hypothetical protein [Actinomycetospora sp. Odt1-22]MDL5155548.1 hypothetical protein [Actinomycetospora sp. Odt1-22]